MVMDSSIEDESNEYDTLFVEVDPTGRYGRYKKILGKGAVKIVYWAFDKLEGKEVAWNQVKLRDVSHGYGDLERLYAEVHLLKTLKHRNIIKFYNYWMDDKNKNINIITEIFTSGTLRQYRKRHKQVDVRAIKNWSSQILQGLLYLHSQDPPIIHRDLKCDNIFVNGGQGEVKIGDLGMAAILHEAHADSIIGTPEFMAPELYQEKYNELVDIYSFGMCLLEMMTFEYPYSECENAIQIYKKVSSGVKPAALNKVKDPSVRQFIEKCLASASERLSARELLKDPFLQNEGESEIMIGNRLPLLGNSFKECKTISEEPHMSGSFGKLSPRSKQGHYDRGSFKTVEEQLACNSIAIKEASVHQEPVDVVNALDDYMQAGGSTSSCKDDSQRHRDIQVKGARKDSNTVFLKLQIADSEGNARNIHFPFDIEADTAMIVASEMVAELDLSDHDVTTIAEMMDVEIAALVPEWKPGVSIDDFSDDHSRVISEDNYSDIKSDDDYLSGEFKLERLRSGRKYWLQSPVPFAGKSSAKTAPVNTPGLEYTVSKEVSFDQPGSDNTIFPTKSNLQGLVPNILDKRDYVKHPTHSEMIDVPDNFTRVSKEQDHPHEIFRSKILAETKDPPVSLQVDETTHENPAVPFLEETGNSKDPLLEEDKRIAWELEKLAIKQQLELQKLKRRHEEALLGLKIQLRLKGCNGRNCFSEASELQQKLPIDRKSYESKSERLSLAEITAATAMVRAIDGSEMHHKKSWDDNCISGHNPGVQDLSPSFKSVHLSELGVDFNPQERLPSNSIFTQQLPDFRPKHGGCETRLRSSFSAADQTHPDCSSSKNDTVETRKSNGPSAREEDLSVPQGECKISSNSFSRTYNLGPHFSQKSSPKTEFECKDALKESAKIGTMGLPSKDESNTDHVTKSKKKPLANERKQHASVKSYKFSEVPSLADLFRIEKESWKLESNRKKFIKQDKAETKSEPSDTVINESVPGLGNVFSVVDKHGRPRSNMKSYKNRFTQKDTPRLEKKDCDGSDRCSSKSVSNKLPKAKGNDKVRYQEKRQPSEKTVSPVEAKTKEELKRSKTSNLTNFSVKGGLKIPIHMSSGIHYFKL